MAIRQPIKNSSNNKQVKNKSKEKKHHQHKNYGTSKLERDFAKDFLDKIGLKYIYQYEAKDIGRFFDFAVTAYDNVPFIMESKDGINSIKQEGQNVPVSFIIEVDGG